MVVGLRNLNSAHLLIWWQIKPPIAIATTTTAPKNDWIYWETQQRKQKLMTKRRVVYSWQSWVGKDEPKEEKKRINGKQRERISSFFRNQPHKNWEEKEMNSDDDDDDSLHSQHTATSAAA